LPAFKVFSFPPIPLFTEAQRVPPLPGIRVGPFRRMWFFLCPPPANFSLFFCLFVGFIRLTKVFLFCTYVRPEFFTYFMFTLTSCFFPQRFWATRTFGHFSRFNFWPPHIPPHPHKRGEFRKPTPFYGNRGHGSPFPVIWGYGACLSPRPPLTQFFFCLTAFKDSSAGLTR